MWFNDGHFAFIFLVSIIIISDEFNRKLSRQSRHTNWDSSTVVVSSFRCKFCLFPSKQFNPHLASASIPQQQHQFLVFISSPFNHRKEREKNFLIKWKFIFGYRKKRGISLVKFFCVLFIHPTILSLSLCCFICIMQKKKKIVVVGFSPNFPSTTRGKQTCFAARAAVERGVIYDRKFCKHLVYDFFVYTSLWIPHCWITSPFSATNFFGFAVDGMVRNRRVEQFVLWAVFGAV